MDIGKYAAAEIYAEMRFTWSMEGGLAVLRATLRDDSFFVGKLFLGRVYSEVGLQARKRQLEETFSRYAMKRCRTVELRDATRVLRTVFDLPSPGLEEFAFPVAPAASLHVGDFRAVRGWKRVFRFHGEYATSGLRIFEEVFDEPGT